MSFKTNLISVIFLLIISKSIHGSCNNAIKEYIEKMKVENNLPGIATLYSDKSDFRFNIEVVGLRKNGDSTKLKITDKFHIGSVTKIMTSMLIAMLVDKKVIQWDSNLQSIFKKKYIIHNDNKKITLRDLINHSSGLPTNYKDIIPRLYSKFSMKKNDPKYLRGIFNSKILSLPNKNKGQNSKYSNIGYVLLGDVIETILKVPFETALYQYIFEPLKMKSCGFGPTSVEGKINQPWGHFLEDDKFIPMQIDNPLFTSPAGGVHCSLSDMYKFMLENFRGRKGKGVLLSSSDTYLKLHETNSRTGNDRSILNSHSVSWNGSNSLNSIKVFIDFDSLVFIVVASNSDFPNRRMVYNRIIDKIKLAIQLGIKY